MSIYQFMEENEIAILAEIDVQNGESLIYKRDIELQSYDLFNQLVLYSHPDGLFASVKDQLMPRIWTQGESKCVVCLINSILICMFYDTNMDAKENYLFAKDLSLKLKRYYS